MSRSTRAGTRMKCALAMVGWAGIICHVWFWPRWPVAPARNGCRGQGVGRVFWRLRLDTARRHAAILGPVPYDGSGTIFHAGRECAVVRGLGAALYSPFFTSAIMDLRDFTWALLCFVARMASKAPPWAVVILAAVCGAGLAVMG